MLQKELAKRLKARYDTKMDGNEWLEVSSDGIPLCRIKYNGQYLSNADQNLSDEYRSKIADIQDEISTVREYVGLYEHAPQMKADGVSDYRQLASFGDTVLAATYNEKNGFMFCTWKQNESGDSVFWGDYSPNYEYVKEAFAVRSGLVSKDRLFSENESAYLCRCVDFAKGNCETLTDNEGEDIGVKLFSETDFGQHLFLTLSEKNTIADANMLTLVIGAASEDIKEELEQDILYDQYDSMDEVISAVRQMTQDAGPVKAVFFCPLIGNIDEGDGDMFAVLGAITLIAHIYNLNNIKSKTVGDGQHGTARWANKAEIRKTYRHIPFTPKKWRKQAKQNQTPTMTATAPRKLLRKKAEPTEEALPQGIVVGCKGGKHSTTAMIDTGDVHVLMIGAAGVGKTAFWLYPCIEYACASGMSFLSTDTKGDVMRNYGNIAKDYGYMVSVIDLRNPTRSNGNNILYLVNKYTDLYAANPDQIVYKAKAEKYAKIISKTIILSGMDAASFGQNAYFYDAAEGLLTATILLVAEFCAPEKRHIVSVFKVIQELLAPSKKKGKNQFQQLKTAHIQCGAPSQRTATIRHGASTTLLRRSENYLSYTKDKNWANGASLTELFSNIFS